MIKTVSSKMNCKTISLARTATNGCSLNGGVYHAATANATTTTAANCIGNLSTILQQQQQHTMSSSMQVQPKANGATIAASPSATAPLSSSTTSPTHPPKKPELAAQIIQQSDIVCFDVDSTVIREEGIDELAEFCGKGSEVARVTKEAMGGAMTFQDALQIRLNIIRPTQQQIADFIRLRPSVLTPNVQRFIEQLKAHDKQVYLISGGFDCLIAPVAQTLGIPLTNLYANKLMFHSNGDYASFDTTQPTSKSGGKAEAIAMIKRQHAPDALITMIGDGATDLEAVPPANHFIGFGGNVVRAEVYKRAQYYVTDFQQLFLS